MEAAFEVIVERQLVLVDPNQGSRRDVRICIGKPYWSIEGVEAACPVAIWGLIGRVADIVGIDPLHALELAIEFVSKYLKESRIGIHLYRLDGEKYEPTS